MRTISTLLLLLLISGLTAFGAAPPGNPVTGATRSVTVDTNGNLLTPQNLFSKNSNLLNQAVNKEPLDVASNHFGSLILITSNGITLVLEAQSNGILTQMTNLAAVVSNALDLKVVTLSNLLGSAAYVPTNAFVARVDAGTNVTTQTNSGVTTVNSSGGGGGGFTGTFSAQFDTNGNIINIILGVPLTNPIVQGGWFSGSTNVNALVSNSAVTAIALTLQNIGTNRYLDVLNSNGQLVAGIGTNAVLMGQQLSVKDVIRMTNFAYSPRLVTGTPAGGAGGLLVERQDNLADYFYASYSSSQLAGIGIPKDAWFETAPPSVAVGVAGVPDGGGAKGVRYGGHQTIAGTGWIKTNATVEGWLQFTNGAGSKMSNTLAAASISVGSSPFSWTNNILQNVTVYVGGGIVTAISINGSSLATGLTMAGVSSFLLQTNESVTVSYTSSPNIFWKPF